MAEAGDGPSHEGGIIHPGVTPAEYSPPVNLAYRDSPSAARSARLIERPGEPAVAIVSNDVIKARASLLNSPEY